MSKKMTQIVIQCQSYQSILIKLRIQMWNILLDFFVLWVILKWLYFYFLIFQEKPFWPFLPILPRAITHSKIVRSTYFFFNMFRTFQCSFLFFELYHFLIIIRHKYQKTEFYGSHLGFSAAILHFRFGSGQNSKALGHP